MAKVALIARWLNPVLSECVNALRQRGIEVTVLIPHEQCFAIDELEVDHDLYLMKAGNAAAHSIASVLHARGARFLNPYPVVALLRDKFRANDALRRAGVRVPDTYMTCERDDVARLIATGPMVVKPPMGSRGRGVAVLHNADDVAAAELERPTLVQRYHAPDETGTDHKVFRIGEELFGVRRPWPLRNYEDKRGTPFEVTAELADLTRAVGNAFGIEMYGVDFVVSEGKPYVVDVNKFGSYMGVPDGPQRLAEFIAGQLQP